MNHRLRSIAIYLPQFHPILENDLWWGKGFTEWTNVTKARPLFKGHYQPHLPSDLGFYDLRLEEVREEQARLARAHCINGFCYYHYWFNGRRLLNRPIDMVLKNRKPEFPFMLCWANENWTRTWDGQNNNILLRQEYSRQDDVQHIQFLFRFFTDERYIRVDGKPFFIVYKPELFPDIKRTTDTWREEAVKSGVGELYLAYFEKDTSGIDPSLIGFDAAIEFQPNFADTDFHVKNGILKRALKTVGLSNNPYLNNKVLDYEILFKKVKNSSAINYKRYPGITPMWDNSARKIKNANIFKNSSPEKYGKWLQHLVENFVPFSKEENFIFINAWNEWAEGNHLEPDRKWGMQYLEKTKAILEDYI